MRIETDRAALLIVDFQERLAAAMAPDVVVSCERNIVLLIELARRRAIPIVVSEQYPKGLGPTVAPIAKALEGLTVERIEKMAFSCVAAPGFTELYRRIGRTQWIVTGMETHVCMYQTARDLVVLGAEVHVPADTVSSRVPANVKVGLQLIERAGAIITATEALIFDALGTAGTEDFRAMAKLVK